MNDKKKLLIEQTVSQLILRFGIFCFQRSEFCVTQNSALCRAFFGICIAVRRTETDIGESDLFILSMFTFSASSFSFFFYLLREKKHAFLVCMYVCSAFIFSTEIKM